MQTMRTSLLLTTCSFLAMSILLFGSSVASGRNTNATRSSNLRLLQADDDFVCPISGGGSGCRVMPPNFECDDDEVGLAETWLLPLCCDTEPQSCPDIEGECTDDDRYFSDCFYCCRVSS